MTVVIDDSKLLLTISEVRTALGGLAASYIYQLLANGTLRSVKIGRRRLIARRDLEEYVERLRECGGEGVA